MDVFKKSNRNFNRGKFNKRNRGNLYGERSRQNNFYRHKQKNHQNTKNTAPCNSSGSVGQFNGDVLSEKEIGVTEYISNNLKGFNGILKARYSDFHVNEIDMDGNIAKLTDLSVPKDPVKVIEEDDEDLLTRYCCEHLPIETWDRIHALVQQNSPTQETIDIDVTNKTKEERTKIHESVKSVFGTKIVGSTIVRNGIKYISFMKYDKNVKMDRREQWPKERGGEYVHFLVYKEYSDTMEAAMRIADSLRIKPSMLSYAGTKDRRGITTQWFCVKRIDPSVLAERCKKIHNIKLGNYCYKKQVLKLGLLKGNRFRIALRNVTAPDDHIDKAVISLKENGFLNYYGLQRFGNSAEVPTYEIGKNLLKGNWKEAIDLILKPRKIESDTTIGLAKKIYKDTGDTKKALSVMGVSRDRTIEGKLLQGLQKHHGNDLVNALESVPRNMRLLYIHAYQSFIWNKILSRRVKQFGLKPIVGDLVLLDSVECPQEIQTEVLKLIDEIETTDPETNENKSLSSSSQTDNLTFTSSDSIKTENPKLSNNRCNITILSEDDLKNYNIYDVVLPMPGFDIQYPNNCIRDWYSELLEADGLTIEMSKIRVRTYCVSGAYRKCVERVNKLNWSIMKYQDPLKSLIQSDYEEMLKLPAPQSNEEGKYKALILDFCLPSSSYATMTLREILKIDTSTAAHAKLNDYHCDEQKRKNVEEEITETVVEKRVKEEPLEINDSPQKQTDQNIKEEKEIKKETEGTVLVAPW